MRHLTLRLSSRNINEEDFSKDSISHKGMLEFALPLNKTFVTVEAIVSLMVSKQSCDPN